MAEDFIPLHRGGDEDKIRKGIKNTSNDVEDDRNLYDNEFFTPANQHGKRNFDSSQKEKKKALSNEKEHLSDALFEYFHAAAQKVNHLKEMDHEEKVLFASNVLEETRGQEIAIISSPTTCRVLEALIPLAPEDSLCILLEALTKDIDYAFTHKSASYISQILIAQIPRLMCTAEENDSAQSSAQHSLSMLCKVALSNFAEYVFDTYASHILRASVEVLSGVQLDESLTRSKTSLLHHQKRNYEKAPFPPQYKPPQELDSIFQEMVAKIFNSHTLKTFIKEPVSNPVVQAALKVLSKTKSTECDKYCVQIAECCTLPEGKLLSNSIASHAVECAIKCANPKARFRIYKKYLRQYVPEIVRDGHGNYIVQRLIQTCLEHAMFIQLFEQLEEDVESLLGLGYFGVVVALSEGCRTHGVNQDSFVKILMKAFHCGAREISDLCSLILTLSTLETYRENAVNGKLDCRQVTFHGSLIVQQLIHFKDPSVAVSWFASLKGDGEILRHLCCHSMTSHVVEAFLSSKSVPADIRSQIIGSLEGQWPQVACSKFGSRVVDRVWAACEPEDMAEIANELVKHKARLMKDRFGQYVWTNSGLDYFKKNRSRWVALIKEQKKGLELNRSKKSDSSSQINKHQGAAPPHKKRKEISTAGV